MKRFFLTALFMCLFFSMSALADVEVYFVPYVGDIDGSIGSDAFLFYEQLREWHDDNSIPVGLSFYPETMNSQRFNQIIADMYTSNNVELILKGEDVYGGKRIDRMSYGEAKQALEAWQNKFVAELETLGYSNIKKPVTYNQLMGKFTENIRDAAHDLGFKIYLEQYVSEEYGYIDILPDFDITQYSVSLTVDDQAGPSHKFKQPEKVIQELLDFNDGHLIYINGVKVVPLLSHQQDFMVSEQSSAVDQQKWDIYTDLLLMARDDPRIQLLRPEEVYDLRHPSGGVCGNNIAEYGEECDGSDLKGESCKSLGFDSGTLLCRNCFFDSADCKYNDVSTGSVIVDFETDKGWTASGTGQGKFEIGVPVAFTARGGECKTTCLGIGPSADHSETGVNAACTNIDGHMGQYETASTNSLTSPVYDFSGAINVNIELWRFMEIEGNNYDFCYYQYKNSEAGQWVNLEKYGATRVDDNDWVKYTKNLSSVAAGKSYFQLRFYCTTDDWTEGSGLCVDDITITDVKPCVPDCKGYVCGMDPVCGTLNCDNPGCTGGDKCENGVCVSCVPDTCASLGYECGVHDDGCGGVTPDCGACSGGDTCQNGICRPPSKGIILVQLDDTSPSELNTANLIVEKFHNEGIALTPEIWPAGLSTSPQLNTALLWDSWPEIEIAQGVYSGNSCGSSLVADIQQGKLEYAAAGITQPTSYLPHMCYPSSSALNGLRDEGILVVIDYIGPGVVRSGDPSEPSQQPLTIDGGRDIASNGIDSYSTVLASVKSQIAAKGYADLAFHVWIIDQSTSQKIITIMKQLKEEGYTFMTATEYYRFLWGGGSSCGNGILETGEECDDGNLLSGDGCSSDCKVELSVCLDNDGDGYYAIDIGCLTGNDCDDNNNMTYPGASEIECNNIDNDCDNLMDEDYVETQTSCGVGACSANGLLQCVDGNEIDSCTPGTPSSEVCDGTIDNDCDGTVDEECLCTDGDTQQCGTTDIGACEYGISTCSAGAWSQCAGAIDPVLEICDYADNDCDALIDEDFPDLGKACTAGIGACEASGNNICTQDGAGTECGASAGQPALDDAMCNGIDDDCDGVIDEDYFSQQTSCGIGACYANGLTSCVAGSIKDSCIPGTPAANDSTCDGIDDDCDGTTDEDCLPVCGVCINSTRICPDGFAAECENFCDELTGLCSNCTPSCEGHQEISYKEVLYTFKVPSGTDDAFEYNGNVNTNGATIGMGNRRYGGFRFNNVDIPQGAIIEDAKLSLAYNWASSSTVNLILYGEDSDNAKQFQSANRDITNRAKTTSVNWNNLRRVGFGVYQSSPNISGIVQPIIDRQNWQEGNSVVILGYPTNNRIWEAVSYEGGAGYSAKLEIKALIPSIQSNPPENKSDIYAGIRCTTSSGIQKEPSKYITGATSFVTSKFSGAIPSVIYGPGYVEDNGSCYLNFPSPGGSYSLISFASTDENEAHLNALDSIGAKIWLQVEPGNADVPTLIDLVLSRYKNHSIIGFGVDVEWLGYPTYPEGRKVTDAEVSQWVSKIKSYNQDYKLFLKHWEAGMMPDNYPAGDVVFIDDSQESGNFNNFLNEFANWGQAFPNSDVGFQVGYPSDKGWWDDYQDPAGKLGTELFDAIPNMRYYYWVDFSIKDVYPSTPPSNPDKIVIVQFDDCSNDWLEDTCRNIVNLHIQKNADIVIGFIPEGIVADGSWKSALQDWNGNHKGLVEIAQHTYDHSSQYTRWSAQAIANDMQKGLNEFGQWGIRPYTFIPAYGWAQNTADGANIAGFHSVMDGLANPYDSGFVGNVLVIHDGIYCGDDYNSCANSDYNSLKSKIDSNIAGKGYANIMIHQGDFGGVGSSKYNTIYSKWSSNIDRLKSDGYTFMTAEEYYQKVKNG